MEKEQKIVHKSWDRRDLFNWITTSNYKTGAEIGVFNGEFLRGLRRERNDIKLYLIDPYKEYIDNSITDSQSVHDHRYNMVKDAISGCNAELIRESSREAISRFEDKSLDFVYIDANHSYEEVLFDINNWSKKVKDGGIIAGHDYDLCHKDVIRGVDEFFIQEKYEFLVICERDSIWVIPKENRI